MARDHIDGRTPDKREWFVLGAIGALVLFWWMLSHVEPVPKPLRWASFW